MFLRERAFGFLNQVLLGRNARLIFHAFLLQCGFACFYFFIQLLFSRDAGERRVLQFFFHLQSRQCLIDRIGFCGDTLRNRRGGLLFDLEPLLERICDVSFCGQMGIGVGSEFAFRAFARGCLLF